MANGDRKSQGKNGKYTNGSHTHYIEDLHDRIDALFGDFVDTFDYPLGPPPQTSPFKVTPYMDVVEKPDAFIITLEIPGVNEIDVEINIAENILTIKGEKKAEATRQKEGEIICDERSYGTFERSFGFRKEIDIERVKSEFENGILTITAPKHEKAVSKSRKNKN